MNIRRWLLTSLVPLAGHLSAASEPSADIPAPTLDSSSLLTPARPRESSAELQQRFAHLFTPLRTDAAALSPDGRYIAYSVREEETVHVYVVEIDHPEVLVAKVIVATDATSTPYLDHGVEKTVAELQWMRWASPTRLVVQTNTISVGGRGEILAFDADGKNAKVLANPKRVGGWMSGTGVGNFTTESPPAEEADAESDELSPVEVDPEDSGTPAKYDLQAVDFVAGSPDRLLLQCRNGLNYWTFTANVTTGSLRVVSMDPWQEGMPPLLTRQGRPRVGISNWSRTPFPHRFVSETNRFLKRWMSLDEVAGIPEGQPGFTVSPENFLGERAFPIGFDENPDILYFAANLGRDTYGIYNLDLAASRRGSLVVENPGLDLASPEPDGFPRERILVFDRFARTLAGVRTRSILVHTAWLRADLGEVQSLVNRSFPGRSVEILEWNEAMDRFLVMVHGITTPGAYHVLQLATGQLAEYAARAPWMAPETMPITLPFSFRRPDGSSLTGAVSLPRRGRLKSIPIVVRLGPDPWTQVLPGFRGDIAALAEMGMAVVQLNARGSWGSGRANRSVDGADLAALQCEDIFFAIEELARRFPLNPSRVALVGSQRGAFIALRAMQLHPDRFRCAVSLDGTIDPLAWMQGERWTQQSLGPMLMRRAFGSTDLLASSPLLTQPEAIKRPVMFMAYRGAFDRETVRNEFVHARRLADALASNGTATEFHDLDDDFMRSRPKAMSEAFARIEKFLNEHIFDYGVTLDDLEIIDN